MKNNTDKVWKNNFYILHLIWKIAPSRVIFSFVLNSVDSIWDIYMSVFLYRYLIDGIMAHKNLWYLFALLGIAAFLFVLRRLLFSVYSFKTERTTDQYIYQALNTRIYEKACDVELAAFENTDFYQTYTKACLETATRPAAVLDNITSFFSISLSIIVMTAALIRIDIFALIFVVFPLISQLLFGKKLNKMQYNVDAENVLPERTKGYVHRTVYLKEYAKELRTSDVFSVLLRNYTQSSGHIVNNITKYGKSLAAHDSLISLFNLYIPFFASCLYAIYKITEQGLMSIGEYSIISVVVISLAGCLKQGAGIYRQAHKDSLYIKNVRDFLDYESAIPESQEGEIPTEFEVLEFKNVSFSYSGADKPVLKDISLTIKAGQTISLAGLNGAGKTTLVKLIMRLYDPQCGVVLYNGKNIKCYAVRPYRQMIAILFQDYRIFSLPVIDNVLMGQERNEKAAAKALQRAGVLKKIEESPLGLQTVIGKEFDDNGIVLSGGESQKLALARVFAHKASLIILDEPSSALDPIAEHEMFENIRNASQNKTTIFISHRLSSTKTADKIYLIDGNTIKEVGTHQELIALNGIYCDMFKKQATAYQGEMQ